MSVRVLVLNDDGVTAAGLAALTMSVVGLDLELRVAAPTRDWSGAGTAVGRLHERGEIAIALTTVAGIPAYAVDGPPALALLLDQLGSFGEPAELVLAGINAGSNCGQWQLHSGTVGAGLAASAYGITGAAFSLAPSEDGRPSWEPASAISRAIVGALLRFPPRGVALNVNIPALPLAALKGWRWTTVSTNGTGRMVQRRKDDKVTVHYERYDPPMRPDTDSGAVNAGYISLGWLRAPFRTVHISAPPADKVAATAAVDAALGVLFPR